TEREDGRSKMGDGGVEVGGRKSEDGNAPSANSQLPSAAKQGKPTAGISMGPVFSTSTEIADCGFENLPIGILGGQDKMQGQAEVCVRRCHFQQCGQGILLQNWNSLDWWVWDSVFEDCGQAISNSPGCGNYNAYRNLFLTMFLGGIWHGAAWTFVFWGALHGTGLAIERFWRERFLKEPSSGKQQQISNNPAFFSTIFVFHFVSFGWIFFRSESFPKALDFLHSMTDFSRVSTRVTPFTVGVVATGALLHFLPENAVDRVIMWIGRIPAPVLGVACGILLMLLSSLSPDEVAPFIYFRF
ncbi:MAG: hypothetical protein EBR01_14575, partial [Proteobacteria bacterium]|nr:hypothetical protein [Pseudomonadota bacterium]